MNLRWFPGVRTIRDADQYKRLLSLRLHPDVVGGDAVLFRAMIDEYDWLVASLRARKVPHTPPAPEPPPQAKEPVESLVPLEPFESDLLGDAFGELLDAGIDIGAKYLAEIAKRYVRKARG